MGQFIGVARTVANGRGTTWTIREWVVGDEWPLRAGARCLVFESDHVFFRLWEYPADWSLLSGAQLLAISGLPLPLPLGST